MKTPFTRRIFFFTSFFLVGLITFSAFLLYCSGRNAPATSKEIKRDTTINPSNSYSDLFFDSTVFEQFLLKAKWHDSLENALRNFYKGRNYEYAWINSEGFNEQAYNFQNLLADYISFSGDSSVHNPYVSNLQDSADKKWLPLLNNDSTRFVIEMAFSSSFLRYARRAYQGNIRLHQDDLNWFIPRRRINPVAILDSFANNKDALNTEPVNQQYGLLKEKLMHFYEWQKKTDLPVITLPKKEYRQGDTSVAITAIKKRLHFFGDFSSEDTGRLYSKGLQNAIAQFQRRHGIKSDGIANVKTVHYLNEPFDKWIKQILINMERMRWIPAQPQGDFVTVNIPQFYLTVFENGNPSFGMNIVVGTTQNRTVIFTGKMKYVVFAPYWNVPPGILKKEVLPAINRNRNYLAQNHMEWFSRGVRQLPGPWNALGKVKFVFPNSYNIYLHDTPAKILFEQSTRAFSHGCIRIQEPEKLAKWVLRNQPPWTPDKIDEALNRTEELFVTIKNPIPVFIGYFTAWVDHSGQINFRDDIYGHDKKMARYLFTN
jgi:murein L,D-transpeptidase YcbB/YkuD